MIQDSCPRKDFICSILSFDRYNGHKEMEQEIETFWRNCIDDLEKLKSETDKIRIWADHTPNARCGLLFVADLLKDSEAEIYVVDLSEHINRDDGIVMEYRGWGEIEPELFGSFLSYEKKLSRNEILGLSKQWQQLKQENAPLRVVENGVVISTEESYYDDLIRKEFPQESCKIANIIGQSLGKQKILTSDFFIYKRLQYFIESGELVILKRTNGWLYDTIVSCPKEK